MLILSPLSPCCAVMAPPSDTAEPGTSNDIHLLLPNCISYYYDNNSDWLFNISGVATPVLPTETQSNGADLTMFTSLFHYCTSYINNNPYLIGRLISQSKVHLLLLLRLHQKLLTIIMDHIYPLMKGSSRPWPGVLLLLILGMIWR